MVINILKAVIILCFIITYDSLSIKMEDISIGVIMDSFGEQGHEAVTCITMNNVNATLHWYNIDTSELYTIFTKVRDLDVNDSIDVIVVLNAHYDVIYSMETVLKTRNIPVIIWGAMKRNNGSQTHLKINSNFRPDSGMCTNDYIMSGPCIESKDSIDSEIYRKWQTLFYGTHTLIKLVEHLGWKKVIILYQRETEIEVQKLEDELPEINVTYSSIVVKLDDLVNLLRHTSEFTLKNGNNIHYIILGGNQFAARVLKTANKLGSTYGNNTLMGSFSTWLLGVYGSVNTTCLLRSAYNLDHVTVVTIPRVDRSTLTDTMLAASVKHCLHYWNWNYTSTFKIQFINKLSKMSSTLMLKSQCQMIKIEALVLTPTGRQFRTVGYVEVTSGDVIVTSDIFPNVKYGYNYREFLVSVKEYFPYVIKTKVNGTVKFKGLCLDILEGLGKRLNFTYMLIEPPDNAYGLLDKMTMRFNGLIGQLQRKEIDMAVGDIGIQRDREHVMDFAYPFMFGYTTVMVKKPDPNLHKWKTLMKPFTWEVIVLVLVCLLSSTVVIYVLEKYNPYYNREAYETDIREYTRHNNCNNGPAMPQWSLVYVAMWLFSLLCNRGTVYRPSSVTGRIFMSTWCFLCVVFIAMYCGNLVAFLTVTKSILPFNSLTELAKLEGKYKWGTIGGSLWESVLTTSNRSDFRAIGEAIRRFNKTDPTVLRKSPEFHIARVEADETYAFIGDSTSIGIAISMDCNLSMIKERFLPLILAFGFQDKSPHTSVISEQLLQMHESGMLGILKRKWWPNMSPCHGNVNAEAKPIQLIDVQSAFYVLLVGMFVSFAALLIENILFKRRIHTTTAH